MTTQAKNDDTKVKIELELSYLIKRYAKNKDRYKDLVDSDDFESAVHYLPDSIICKRHQLFVKNFKLDKLDKITEELLAKIFSNSVDNSSSVEQIVVATAVVKALKEQYQLCIAINNFIKYGTFYA